MRRERRPRALGAVVTAASEPWQDGISLCESEGASKTAMAPIGTSDDTGEALPSDLVTDQRRVETRDTHHRGRTRQNEE
jgi:hypothetical protein